MIKVLIAEDDLMIADMAEEMLVERGYEVCGIARTVAEAVALGRLHKPHLAVIDLRLADGGLGTEVRPIGNAWSARCPLCHRQHLPRRAARRLR
jgi:response regulator of citrate/malate metabolism